MVLLGCACIVVFAAIGYLMQLQFESHDAQVGVTILFGFIGGLSAVQFWKEAVLDWLEKRESK